MTDAAAPGPAPTPPRVPPGAPAARSRAVPTPPAEPWSGAELHDALRSPGRALDVVLAHPGRLAATLGVSLQLRQLLPLLLACTVLATIPYGLVLGGGAVWKIGVLFGGSVLLCQPSLLVFAAFLGRALHPLQALALALVVSAVAALFTFGFWPILWFLGASMQAGDRITAADASIVMLVTAGLAGLLQLSRCAARIPRGDATVDVALLFPWQALVVYVMLRMASVLDLLG